MAGRTEAALAAAASKLDIPRHDTDWRRLLGDLSPDIVAVATPGGTHLEHCLGAIDAGCHVLCEKPLATTAADARDIYSRAKSRGVLTAFAASFRYQPQVSFARDLVRGGSMGRVLEAECVSHYHWPRMMPFGWPHRLDQGGGRLNNNFSHKFAIVQRVVGGDVIEAMGETRNDLRRAPIGERVHDFRDLRDRAAEIEERGAHEWAEVDSDWSYTVLLRLGARGVARDRSTSAVFRHSGLARGRIEDYVAFYCEKGTIHIDGAYAQGEVHVAPEGQSWSRPLSGDGDGGGAGSVVDLSFDNWDRLVGEFVDDIRGKGNAGYPTFRDGWICQQIIDAARSGDGWTPVEPDLPDGE